MRDGGEWRGFCVGDKGMRLDGVGECLEGDYVARSSVSYSVASNFFGW